MNICCNSKEQIKIYFKIVISTKRFAFFGIFVDLSILINIYIYICKSISVKDPIFGFQNFKAVDFGNK